MTPGADGRDLAADRARAVAFLRDRARAEASRVVPLPFGFAALDEELPDVWDLNSLWVEHGEDLGGEELAAAADRVLGGAGLAHRQAVVLEDRAGSRLARQLEALAWEPVRHVLMAHRGDARPPGADAPEIAQEEMDELRESFLREDASEALPDDLVRQLVASARRGARRSYAVKVGGTPVSGCDLFEGDGVAQIESVVTLPGYRGRGLASAVVLAALAAARERGARLVFLQAIEEQRPAQLYARLGFERIGRVWLLRRATSAISRPRTRPDRASARPS